MTLKLTIDELTIDEINNCLNYQLMKSPVDEKS
jgi:hypothetical protein